MDATDDDFTSLIQQVQAGSEEAASRLFDQYGRYVYRIVRRKLARELRQKFDSQDFSQAVWISFFADLPRIGTFETPRQLIAFLSQMAANKVTDEFRRRVVLQKANVRREVPLSDGSTVVAARTRTRVHTPSKLAMAKEQFEALGADQPQAYRRIVELRAEGATSPEMAGQVGMSPGHVRRIITKLMRRIIR